MQQYLALTLGPIHKTILRQRRTRAVFAASYLFSYTMKKVMEALIAKGITTKQFIMPSPDYLDKADFIHPGCGLYTDRLVLIQQKETDFEDLLMACKEVIQDLATKINISKDYLEQYLQLYSLQITLAQDKTNLERINQALDDLELQTNFPHGADADQLQVLFNQVGGHFLLKDAFGSKKQRFDSLVEIATRGLGRIDERSTQYEAIVKASIEELKNSDLVNAEAEETGFFNGLAKDFEDELQSYHRYVALVVADADSMGKYVEALEGQQEALLKVSNQLMEHGKNSKDKIVEYGGAPVYIGGDDLLFFAPVVSMETGENGQGKLVNIFDLVETIDGVFHQQFPKKEGGPTLSYGICLFYYKFPLNEALNMGYDLLYTAKDKKQHPKKNTIAFKVLKHSGQYFETSIEKSDKENSIYHLFKQLIGNQEQDEQFLNSIGHKMAFFQDVIGNLIADKDEQAIEHLFKNTFDENIHKQNEDFMNAVITYIIATYKHYYQHYSQRFTLLGHEVFKEEYKEENALSITNKKAVANVYATLRFIDFIRTKSNANVLKN